MKRLPAFATAAFAAYVLVLAGLAVWRTPQFVRQLRAASPVEDGMKRVCLNCGSNRFEIVDGLSRTSVLVQCAACHVAVVEVPERPGPAKANAIRYAGVLVKPDTADRPAPAQPVTASVH